jgi:hypothetical protein
VLDKTLSSTTTAPRQTLRCRPIKIVTAQNIAKAERSDGMRAGLAVQWIKNLLAIDQRTGSMAAAIFDCCPSSISRALAESQEAPATAVELLMHQWQQTSDAERDVFVRGRLVELWDRIDRLTR